MGWADSPYARFSNKFKLVRIRNKSHLHNRMRAAFRYWSVFPQNYQNFYWNCFSKSPAKSQDSRVLIPVLRGICVPYATKPCSLLNASPKITECLRGNLQQVWDLKTFPRVSLVSYGMLYPTERSYYRIVCLLRCTFLYHILSFFNTIQKSFP